MKNFSRVIIGMVVCLMMVWPQTGIAKTKKLTIQCAYPETAYVGQTTKFFAERVEALTNGEVTVKVFWPGQLVKTKEAFESVRVGMIDGYSGSMLYFAGIIPEVNCEWLPFGWRTPKEASEVYEKYGWLELMREATEQHGIRYIAPIAVASMGLITKSPVRTVDDLKGMKIRAVGMEAKIIAALGGSSVSISGAEQYMALKQGIVDGTDYPFYTIGKYKFYEVCDYITRPALHTPGMVEIIMNEDSYASLSEAQQKAVDQAGWDAFQRTVELNEKWDQEAYDTCKEKDVEIIDLTPEALDEFRARVYPLWDEVAEKSDISKRLVEKLKEFLGDKGVKLQ